MRPVDRQSGLTIIELVIAMALTTILVAMAMQISVTVLNGYRHHREAVGIQRSARGTLDIVVDSVRNGSAGVPSGKITDAAGCTIHGPLHVVNSTDAPDELYVTSATGGVITSLREEHIYGASSATVLNAEGLYAGDLVLVTDFQEGHILRVESDPIDNGSSWTVPLESGGCSGVTYHYTRGAMMLRVRVSHFYVSDVDGVPTMFLDDDSDGPSVAEPLAEGVEDFQIAVGIDLDLDGRVVDAADTADEWYYNAEGDADPPTVATRPWRALRMTIVARGVREEAGAEWSARPEAEDRDGASVDGFRRRMVSTIVEIRNLEGSP